MLSYKDLLALPQASEPENPYNVQRVGLNFRVLFTRRDGKQVPVRVNGAYEWTSHQAAEDAATLAYWRAERAGCFSGSFRA
jgi:hypothetical protein